ncbi:DUF1707 SHOCT-like domain-containing protein [Nocardia sp. alder85J]|uniref:DUF1707 SHOCT-like domain-containing protein n=1 Tax=Nocardia sp. alder85J TaxID=2862949 RepID=UPI001CD2FE65|nr:DUF1707 domain-containing protein [Nocardia sp. alder85J]MCX4096011.1 DUF1707 domain-containing protein [Nocardia sp. alder85J]
MLDQAPPAKDIAYACMLLNSAYAAGRLDGEEHRTRVDAAMSATTIGELRSLTNDLRSPPPGAVLGQYGSGPVRSRRAVVTAAIIGVSAAVGYGLGVATRPGSRDTVTAGGGDAGNGWATTAPSPTAAAPRALHTAAGFSALVAAVSRKFGDTVVDDATVYPDYAVVTRGVPGEPAHAMNYYYKGGFDKGTPTPRQPGTGTVDLSRVDVGKVMDLLASAPQTVAVPQPKSTYFIVDGMMGSRVVIYETDSYNVSGYLIAGLDGAVDSVHAAPH